MGEGGDDDIVTGNVFIAVVCGCVDGLDRRGQWRFQRSKGRVVWSGVESVQRCF